ncbi:MAG TPA: pentapeptide repeat-containing protein, partial [Coleofasciculaceae cyanobacterium]
ELIREGLAHASRSLEAIANLLQGRNPQQLRYQMQVAALTIIQAGQYRVSTDAIGKRLEREPTSDIFPPALPAFFFRSQPKGKWGEDMGIPQFSDRGNASLYASSSSPPQVRLEFSHSSLGEYLGAEEIAKQLTTLTQKVQNQYGEVTFFIQDAVNVAQHIYGLLGYGILSPELEALVIERLRREQKRNADVFSFAVLWQRLYRFYRAYCRGQWLDEGIAHQAHSQLQLLQNPSNVLQVDAAVGLNVFLLLARGAREAQIPFWPCGNPDIPQEFDPDQLLSFIGRTAALSPTVFWQRARGSLSQLHLAEACLNQVMLAEANLEYADLSTAELVGINLAGANLRHTNLSWASLVGANFSNANLLEANLEGADLTGANLKGANLKSANLAHACLFQAQLDEQSQNVANHSGAIFSPDEFHSYKQSLTPTKIIGKFDDEELLEDETPIFIESAEGELILPDVQYGDEGEEDEYEGETVQLENSMHESRDFSDDEYGDAETAIANPRDYA